MNDHQAPEADEDSIEGERHEIGHDGSDDEDALVTSHSLFHDALPGTSLPIIFDTDGLPRPADDGQLAKAPPFSIESFVCIEDDSEYVEVFEEELAGHLLGRLRGPRSDWSLRSEWDAYGRSVTPRVYAKGKVILHYGETCVTGEGDERFIPVRPKRPKCDYLVTRLDIDTNIDNQGAPAKPVLRFCKAFMTKAGAFFSLLDENVLACTHRSPIDVPTHALIRQRELSQIKAGAERVDYPMFNLRPPEDWDAKAMAADCGRGADQWRPSVTTGELWLTGPAIARLSVERFKLVVLADAAWQPPDSYMGNRKNLLRADITRPDLQHDAGWPKNSGQILGLQILKESAAVAEELLAGNDVLIITANPDVGHFFAACCLANLDPQKYATTVAWPDEFGTMPPAWARWIKRIADARAEKAATVSAVPDPGET